MNKYRHLILVGILILNKPQYGCSDKVNFLAGIGKQYLANPNSQLYISNVKEELSDKLINCINGEFERLKLDYKFHRNLLNPDIYILEHIEENN